MRSFYAVSLALFTGMLLLAFTLTTDMKGLSARSAEAASAVKVAVNCRSTPETTRVTNNTNRRIVVKKVGSIYQPRDNEPFTVKVSVRPGKAVAFQSGSGARGRVLTGQYIYENDVGRTEGARVVTSIGRFVDRC